MLQHEPPAAEQTPPAAERRVTPEELAKALAAVEARKEQSSRETEGTIPIGEAVQQLGFDVTPDEIWTEVQAERAKIAGKGKRRRWAIWPTAFGLFLLIAGVIDRLGLDIRSVQNQPPTMIKTFENIPNNGTFYCDEDAARELVQHSFMVSNSLVVDNVLVTAGRPLTSAQEDVSWTFTIHDGMLYVHGYTAPRSTKALELGPVPIYNSKIHDTGAGGLNYTQPITLAVGTFHVDSFTDSDFGGMTKEMVASEIHPDQHFGDNW